MNDVANNKFIKEDFNNYGTIYGIKGPHIKFETYIKGTMEYQHNFEQDYRAFYYEGGPINTNGSNGLDLRGHSLGKRSYHWKFERSDWGALRRVECKVSYNYINMPISTYPFIGLED